jgi:hypothetical protein
MKEKVEHPEKNLPEGDAKKVAQTPDSVMRREALKRIAYLAIGSITGSILINSCYTDYSDYEDYSDYYDYYSRSYSESYYYYDYYSVYSVYWD